MESKKRLPLHSLLRSKPHEVPQRRRRGGRKPGKVKILLKILQIKNFDLPLQNISAVKNVDAGKTRKRENIEMIKWTKVVQEH